MILFQETRQATLDDVRWLRKNLGRRLEDSCLRSIDPKLYDRRVTLSLIDSILLAVTEIGNNVVQHATPKPTFLSLEVRLMGSSLRIEFTNDGGGFEEFAHVLESAGRVRHSADLISGRGLSLVSQSLQDLEYIPGSPNRLIGWRKLRKARPQVLVVEEDPADGAYLRTMLHQNYSVRQARSLSEAHAILSAQRVDVVLAGFKHCREGHNVFKAAFDQAPIPVVLMASAHEYEELRRLPLPYVDSCLERPISTSGLIAALEIAIASYTRRLIHLANHFGREAAVLLAEDLPRELPGYNLAVLSQTASYGGGDFALALKGEGYTRLILADIMGHGLKAKAAAVALSAILRTLHGQCAVPADLLLKNVSHVINGEPAFTDIISTMIIVDAGEDGWIEAACAGHPPVAIISPEKSFVLPVSGPLPGLFSAPAYMLARHRIVPGDKLVIITDGIDNHASATADFPERILRELSRDPHSPLAKMKKSMAEWLTVKLGPAPKDDWTLLIAEYCGAPAHGWRRHREPASTLSPPSSELPRDAMN